MSDEPEPFATVEDLKRRWPESNTLDYDHVETVLADVSAYIRAMYPDQVGGVSEDVLRMITCRVAKTSLDVDPEMSGYETTTETAGQISLSLRPANPFGDFKLTPDEKKMLSGGAIRKAWSFDVLGG